MKNKYFKKPGFTLIELIAVLAIIAILFAVLTPKVTSYINEAKRTRALEEVREVVMAADTYNVRENGAIVDTTTFNKIKNDINSYGDKDLLTSLNKIKTIDDSMTYGVMKEILEGSKTFNLSDSGKITDIKNVSS